MNPIVSVIIPVYNSASTIERCIDSIIKQKFADFEVLLVNDGSIDNGLDIMQKQAERDSRVIVIDKIHEGVSAARNFALRRARGNYVCFVDADDTIEPEYLSEMLAHREADMVICGYYVDIFQNGKMKQQEIHLPDSVSWTSKNRREILLPLFMSGMIHINCNKLLHRNLVVDNMLEYRQQPVNEDYMFMLSYLNHAQRVFTVRKPLYHWNRLEGAKTGVDSMPENLLELYNEAHQLTRSFFCNNKVADESLYYSYNYIVLKYFTAYSEGRMSKKMLKSKLSDFHCNYLVRAAYAAHQPISHGEWLFHFLQEQGCFSLYRWLLNRMKGWKNKSQC